ncbi:MAG: TatD family hydrolase [Candidatus Binatia bacterium]|jgi:TatD DNase family protein|nr:TatD family hydrolase [Candidatus Binatia bacterium]
MTHGLVDSHSHIQGEEFSSDVEGVLERARQAGVEKIIVVGGAGGISSNGGALELAARAPELFATVGMHPHDAREISGEDLDRLKEMAKDPKVVAVGETGLDFYYNHSPREVQIKLFRRFIHLARETDLPIVIHDRDADPEVADLVWSEGKGELRGVVHCFTGDLAAAKSFLDLGLYLSFTGIVTFKNAGPLREVVRQIPMDRILVETDAPYLAPVPKRGKRNEPAFVRFVAEAVAEIKGLALDEMAQATSSNAESLFGI